MLITRFLCFIDIVFNFQLIIGLHASRNGMPNIIATSASRISNRRWTDTSPNVTSVVVYELVLMIFPSASFTDIDLSSIISKLYFLAECKLIKLLVAPESTKVITLDEPKRHTTSNNFFIGLIVVFATFVFNNLKLLRRPCFSFLKL